MLWQCAKNSGVSVLNLSVEGHKVYRSLPKAAAIVRPAIVNGLHTDCYGYIIIIISSSSSSSSSVSSSSSSNSSSSGGSSSSGSIVIVVVVVV